MRRILCITLVLAVMVMAFSGVALAASPQLTESRSTFPFTGLEIGLVVVGALVLIGLGVVLRKASR